MENKEFENIIKNILKESHNQGALNERFDDEDEDENLGIYSGNFDADEFSGDAMKAAMQDIGSEFEPLGKSKFEKNLNPDEFISDLERQNLNLPNDKVERQKLKKALDTKKNHEKIFGAGSLNEGDEIKYKGVVIKVLQPSGYFEFYSDKEGRFLKFDELDSAKARIDSELENNINEQNNFDTKSFYHFLKDALYHAESKSLDYAQTAKMLEEAIMENYNIEKKLQENIESPEVKAYFPKDSEGNKLKINTIVKHINSNHEGRIKRFGTTENGQKLVADVEWFDNNAPIQGIQTPPPNKIAPELLVIRKKEDEIEEGMSHSHTMGRGQNLKPNNYPNTLKREGLSENLDSAQIAKSNKTTFIVVNDAFNRAHYADLIGKTFDNPPGYARVKQINIEDADTESKIDYDLDEDFDYAAAERAYHDAKDYEEKQNLIGKQIVITNINAIQEMLFPNTKRIQSILDSIKEEIANHRVFNNVIAATDNMDTTWLFDLKNVTDDTIELQFTGTAK